MVRAVAFLNKTHSSDMFSSNIRQIWCRSSSQISDVVLTAKENLEQGVGQGRERTESLPFVRDDPSWRDRLSEIVRGSLLLSLLKQIDMMWDETKTCLAVRTGRLLAGIAFIVMKLLLPRMITTLGNLVM